MIDMNKTFKDLRVGDEVFVVDQLKRGQKEQVKKTCKITRVGRVYLYIDMYGKDAPFCLDSGMSHHKEWTTRANGYGFDVFIDEEDYLTKKEEEKLVETLSIRLVSNGRVVALPIDVVKSIHKILDDMESLGE